MTDPLTESLDALVDPCLRERGDWEDVLGRAALRRSKAPRRRRRRMAVALAGLVVLVVLATPAFGLRESVLQWIGRADVPFNESEPAPRLVRRQFEELSIGAPSGMDPQAIPGETRKVGTLSVGGRPRPLWVAPTSRGGFCYMLERVGGGCLRNEAFELPTIAVTGSQRMLRGGPFELTLLGGTVHSDRVQRLTVEYRDGHREDVPFVYVSAPIDAGFFSYDVPAGRRERPSAPVAVAGWDADDKLVHREPVRFGPMPLPFPARAEPQTLPAQPPKPPAAPFQRASAKGVSVVAGRNGIAVFDATGLRDDIASMLEARRVGLGCFKLRGDGSDARSLLVSGKFSRRVGLELSGLGTPFDGCEIQGSYGHAWPDRLGSHSAVELPFTIAGRRYFDDRAAARDLALFVRSRKVQQIRKEPGEKLAAALKANYGDAIVRLSSRDAQPPPATIGYWVRDGQASFVRLSPTGRRFLVDTQAGRIVHENVKPLALVF